MCALALVNRITLGPLPLADQPYFLCLTNPLPLLYPYPYPYKPCHMCA